MAVITSRQNEKVKLARALQRRKTREAEGRFLVEGTFHIGEALAASAPLEFILYCPEQLRGDFALQLLADLRAKGVDCHEVSPDVMDSLTGKENPQGFLGIAKQQYQSLSSFHPSPSSLSLALVQPADPGNLGAILRTMDAGGASALILLDGGVDPYHPTAVRAGLGAHFWQPIIRAGFREFRDWAAEEGVQVIGSSAHGEVDYRAAEVRPPGVLLLGSEREGLSDQQRSICQQVLTLPMRGRTTSLNLAVAAGILLYALQSKRDGSSA